MNSREFAYWLQGFFELSDSTELTPEQVSIVKKHLDMVFVHEIDPSYPEAEKLQEIHDGVKELEKRVDDLTVTKVDEKLGEPPEDTLQDLLKEKTPKGPWDGRMRC
jgi:squalene cyclase